MRTSLIAILIASTALFAASETKPKDLCAPPPGAAAPTLPARIMTGQGHISFPITTSSEKAQEFFNQGVAQMHSFWAFEAERSFLARPLQLDPQAPMPYWGIAMVAVGDYRPYFQLVRDKVPSNVAVAKQDDTPRIQTGGPARAAAAVKKALELSSVPGKATDLERLCIASIAARRNPDSKDPDGDYIKGLRAVVAAYPNEVEAKTYLALHLMQGFTTPDKRPLPGTMEAVAILRELLVSAPDHMGVHHYVIHGFEGSTFAKDAWPSCRRYPEMVPNIPHALHMPGHIWAQTGKWEEAEEVLRECRRKRARLHRGRQAVQPRTSRPQRPFPDHDVLLPGQVREGHGGRARAARVRRESAREGRRRQLVHRLPAGLVRPDGNSGSLRKVGRDSGG